METKRSVVEMRLIQADLPYRGMLAVPSVRRCGGLALLWMEEIELHVQTFTLNHIDALIMNDTNNPWRLTGFYGWPDEMMKHKSFGNYLSTSILDIQSHGSVAATSTRF